MKVREERRKNLFYRGSESCATLEGRGCVLVVETLNKNGMEVYFQQIKKKAKAEGKTCHAKTMLSLEKPIKLL